MKKKATKREPEFFNEKPWHNGADLEIHLYTQALRKSAKALVKDLDLTNEMGSIWDACSIILLYRQALELNLKGVVDAGNPFVAWPTDPHSLYKTHSLRWLAQLIGQIIKAVRWEDTFKCEGVSTLAGFSALMNEVEELDPLFLATHLLTPHAGRPVPDQLLPANFVAFAKKLDALLVLLDATADALAATWYLQQDTDSNPTIQ